MCCNIIEVLYISILCMCRPIYIHVYNEQYPCDTKYSYVFATDDTSFPKGRFVHTRTVSPWSTQRPVKHNVMTADSLMRRTGDPNHTKS